MWLDQVLVAGRRHACSWSSPVLAIPFASPAVVRPVTAGSCPFDMG